MQQFVVVATLFLYAAFSFNPVAEISVFSRTLNLSPGDMLTILLVFGIAIKELVRNQKNRVVIRPPAVMRFLLAWVFLAVTFLLPTFLFFILHNEFAGFLPRSLFNYLLWSIALVLFYYGSESQLKVKDLRIIVWVLMGAFIAGALGNMFNNASGLNLIGLITDTFKSQNLRLSGQTADPNQLGALAAFFSILGIMGALYEKKAAAQAFFFLLAVGTSLLLLLTQSREALLTAFISLLSLSVVLMRGRHYLKALIVGLGLILGTAFSVTHIPRIAETLSAIGVGNTGYALSARDHVWRVAWSIVSTHPLGIGFETLSYLTDNTVQQAHNALLQSAIIAGLAGVGAFICFLVFLFKLLRERAKLVPDNWMITAYFVFSLGYLVTSLGSDHFISFATFNAIFFGLLGFVACAR